MRRLGLACVLVVAAGCVGRGGDEGGEGSVVTAPEVGVEGYVPMYPAIDHLPAAMVEAIDRTDRTTMAVVGVLAARGNLARFGQGRIGSCEDSGRESLPDYTVTLSPVPGEDRAVAASEVLVSSGAEALESERFDEGTAQFGAGRTVVAARWAGNLVRVWFDGERELVFVNVLGTCLPNTREQRIQYIELMPWQLELPAAVTGG